MGAVISAGEPLEVPCGPVGRSSSALADSARDGRMLGVDCWYPARVGDHSPSVYELLPGIGFTAAAMADAEIAPGVHPLVVFSHGRSGTRSSYAMLCEGLAARGYIVVAPDHPGDTLADWLLGSAVDDTTNERQRVADMRFVVDAVLAGGVGPAAAAAIDAARVGVAGHSYGAYTAFAFAGTEAGPRVGAVAGLQSFTRTLPAEVLARIDVPALLIAGANDTTCPLATDADPAYAALGRRDAQRFDIERAGHQACSDVGLYLELQPQIDGLPDIVVEFLQSLAAQVTGTAGDPWRPTAGLHLRILGAWLDDVFDRQAGNARQDLDEVRNMSRVTTPTRESVREVRPRAGRSRAT
jgi:pimeloyl-ACP methyl ester carboxylesterase